MAGVGRWSDVGRATSCYCATYKGLDATHKCIFLTTCQRWVFAQMRNPPLKRPKPVGHPLSRNPLGSTALLAGESGVHPLCTPCAPLVLMDQ
jgi:hypothetical protein